MDCSVKTCERTARYVGLCASHYERRRSGKVDWDKPIQRRRKPGEPETETCSVDGCERLYCADGLCDTHYARKKRGVPIVAPLRAPRAVNGEWTPWRVTKKGYVVRTRVTPTGHEEQSQHRFVMEQHLGRALLPGENVHHKNDGTRSNNDISNLELWSTAQPPGQRVEDKVVFAIEVLKLYRPELLA